MRISDWSSDVCSSDLIPFARRGNLRQRDLQFIQPVMPRLVDARRLAGRPDAQPRKQVGQRRMPLPIEHKTLQQVGPPDKGGIVQARTPQHDMIAAPGPHRPPVRSEEHTSELQSLMRNSYAVF